MSWICWELISIYLFLSLATCQVHYNFLGNLNTLNSFKLGGKTGMYWDPICITRYLLTAMQIWEFKSKQHKEELPLCNILIAFFFPLDMF